MATYEPFSCYVHVDDDTGGIIWPDNEEGPNWGIGKVMTDHVQMWVFNDADSKWEIGENEHLDTAKTRWFYDFQFNTTDRKITPAHQIATITRAAAAAHSKVVFAADRDDKIIVLKVHPASAKGKRITFTTMADAAYDLGEGTVILTRCANPPSEAERALADRVFARRMGINVAKRAPTRDGSKGRAEDHNWGSALQDDDASAPEPLLVSGKEYSFKLKRKDGAIIERTGTAQGDDMVTFVAPDGGKRVVRFPPQDCELLNIKLLSTQSSQGVIAKKTGLDGKDMETWAPFMGAPNALETLKQELFRVYEATGIARRERAIAGIMKWASKAGPNWEADQDNAETGRTMIFDLRCMVTASTKKVKEEELRKKVMAGLGNADVFDVAADKLQKEDRRGGGGRGGGYNGGGCGNNGGRNNRDPRGGQGQAGARERLCHHCQKPGHLIAACLAKKAGKPKTPKLAGNRQGGDAEESD